MDGPSHHERPAVVDDADLLVERTREVVAAVARSVHRHRDEAVAGAQVETLSASLDVLAGQERHLRLCLREPGREGADDDTPLLELLVQVQSLRLRIGEERLRRRAATARELHLSLSRLRAGSSTAELLRAAPRELGRLGFSRALVSGLHGSIWTARTAHAHDDETLAGALVQVGSALPGRIGREEPETEAVRGRTAVLVRDAQNRAHVHRELVTLGDTRDYVVAPVVVHGRVVGLVHVDRHSQSDIVDPADQDLLTLFADGMGLAFERARYLERLTSLRRRFERQIADVDDVVHGAVGWSDPDARTADHDLLEPAPHPHLSRGPLGELTRRELEVLQHLAGGASNQDIAVRLGVTAGTVKTHVKGVLRKLGATSRADAAARFHAWARRSALEQPRR